MRIVVAVVYPGDPLLSHAQAAQTTLGLNVSAKELEIGQAALGEECPVCLQRVDPYPSVP